VRRSLLLLAARATVFEPAAAWVDRRAMK